MLSVREAKRSSLIDCAEAQALEGSKGFLSRPACRWMAHGEFGQILRWLEPSFD
jgi:hypothetical protein